MTPYEPEDNFPDISIFDTDDPVIGGEDGVSNDPVKKLADRTQYLYNRLGRFSGHRIVTANASITTADIFKCVKAVTTANISLSLASVAGFPVGALIKIKVKITSGIKCVRIVPNGSEVVEDGNVNMASASVALYMHDGEEITLMAGDANADGTADYWDMINAKGNFYEVGNDGQKRIQPRNTIIANGCQPEISGSLYNRADMARLWQAVSAYAVTDATWLSNIRYRQFFSTGNGSTTMRVPDMRSMVWKGLDMGRALSLGRLDSNPGGLELDELKAHTHTLFFSEYPDATSGSPGYDGGSNHYQQNVNKATSSTGGTENLIKTAGFIPVIYY